MPVTAVSGVISNAKDKFRTTIASCAAFRTWEGNSWSVDQAKERIYFDALPPPENDAEAYTLDELNNLRPFCLIYKPTDFGVTLISVASGSTGGSHAFIRSGTLVAEFHRNVPIEYINDPGEVDRQFENFMGALISSGDVSNPGLAELAGTPNYLTITEIRELGPIRSKPDEQPSMGDFQVYYLQVEWGVARK